MSADLLRRAATLLRSRLNDLPITFRAAWDQDSSEIYTAIAGPDGMCQWVGEALHDGGDEVAAHIVLMHPPVALALADLLDEMAQVADGNGLVDDDRQPAGAVLARAILREAP